jgi:hypothetical protein
MISRKEHRVLEKFLLCCLCVSARGFPEVIDRVVVTVDQQVITLSAVREEIRLAAFLNGEKPDFSSEARRRAAGRLVERLLIEREMEQTRFPAAPPEEAARMREQIRGERREAAFKEALAASEISEETLRQYLIRQATLLRFLEMRFRPEVQVSEEEVRECVQKRGPKTTAPPEEARVQCEEALVAAGVDKAVDRWMKEARERPRIVYREEAFQ